MKNSNWHETARQLARQGWSARQVAAHFGVHYVSAWKALNPDKAKANRKRFKEQNPESVKKSYTQYNHKRYGQPKPNKNRAAIKALAAQGWQTETIAATLRLKVSTVEKELRTPD